MKREMTCFFVVLLMFFAVGCSNNKTVSTTGNAFVGGTDGLKISFLSGSPPDSVFDNDDPFSVAVKVENNGEFDISDRHDVQVTISGINPSDFGVSASDLTEDVPEELEGKHLDSKKNVDSGYSTEVEFPEMNYKSNLSGSVDFKLRANVCYEYGTTIQGTLCVREDLRDEDNSNTGVCNPDGTVSYECSSAPIQVSSFKQSVVSSNKINFFFTIKNKGASTDSLHKSGTSCDTSVQNEDVVWVDVEDTGLGDLTCSGLKNGTDTSGYVTLYDGEREVRCTQTIDDLGDFTKLVTINIKYGYKQYVDKTITVKHAE